MVLFIAELLLHALLRYASNGSAVSCRLRKKNGVGASGLSPTGNSPVRSARRAWTLRRRPFSSVWPKIAADGLTSVGTPAPGSGRFGSPSAMVISHSVRLYGYFCLGLWVSLCSAGDIRLT